MLKMFNIPVWSLKIFKGTVCWEIKLESSCAYECMHNFRSGFKNGAEDSMQGIGHAIPRWSSWERPPISWQSLGAIPAPHPSSSHQLASPTLWLSLEALGPAYFYLSSFPVRGNETKDKRQLKSELVLNTGATRCKKRSSNSLKSWDTV